MKPQPSLAVNAALGVLLAAGAYAVYETFAADDGTAAVAAERTITVRRGTVTRTATADGTLESARTASASFATSGTVTEIRVQAGDKVKKSQILAKVDSAAANRALNAARADLDAARDSLARAQDAETDTAETDTAETGITEAENEVSRAELAVDEAEAGVAGTVLRAPMAGTVIAVSGTIGSAADEAKPSGEDTASTGFIELADLSKMQVTAAFAEADATSLKEKQPATVTWNALSGVRQTAKLAAVDPSATTTNSVVTYGVTLTLDKVPAGAKVGQTVAVAVTTGEVENAVLVNAAAITTAGSRHTVTVITGGIQETRPVQIGLEGDTATEITSGLTAGEQVVLRTTSTGTGDEPEGFPGGGFGGPPGGGGMPGGGGGRGGR